MPIDDQGTLLWSNRVGLIVYFCEGGGDHTPWEWWHISVRGYWKGLTGLGLLLGNFREAVKKVGLEVGCLQEAEIILRWSILSFI